MSEKHLKACISYILIGIFAVMLMHASVCHAGSAGTSAAQFLKIGLGARPVGMGEAYVGLADDVHSVVWNPAGLTAISRSEESFMHTVWFEGIRINYLAFGHRLDAKSGIGVSMVYLTSGEIQRLNKFGEDRGSYSASDLSLSAAYGRRLFRDLALGINLKAIKQDIEKETAKGFAGDIGLLWQKEVWGAGLSVQNIGAKITFRETAEPLPLTIRCGGLYRPRDGINVTADIVVPNDNDASFHAGGEYEYAKFANTQFVLRCGFNTARLDDLGSLAGLSVGLGFTLQGWCLDYSWVPYGLLGASHRIGLSRKFSMIASENLGRDAEESRRTVRKNRDAQTVYKEALEWFSQKEEEENLSEADKKLILRRLQNRFEPMGIDVHEIKEKLKKYK